MTNINCSACCSHESNGKCTLNHISLSSSFTGAGADCAYFEPRESISKISSSKTGPYK
jgi:hypothetical protein